MNPVERPSKNLEQALKRKRQQSVCGWKEVLLNPVSTRKSPKSDSAKPRTNAGLSDHVLTWLMKTETWAQFVLEAVQQEVCLEAVQHNVYTCSYIFHPTRRHVAHTRRCHVFISVIAPTQTYALTENTCRIELFQRKVATAATVGMFRAQVGM